MPTDNPFSSSFSTTAAKKDELGYGSSRVSKNAAKAARLELITEIKKQKAGPTYNYLELDKDNYLDDGDTLNYEGLYGENKELRFASPDDELKSLDTFERYHGAAWIADPGNRARVDRQRGVIAKERGVHVSEIPDHEVYNRSVSSTEKLRNLIEADQPEYDPNKLGPEMPLEVLVKELGTDVYGRDLGEIYNAYNEQNINEQLNNPQDNASYDSLFNVGKQIEDLKEFRNTPEFRATQERTGGEVGKDILNAGVQGSLVFGETVYAANDLASRILREPFNIAKRVKAALTPGEEYKPSKSFDQVARDFGAAPKFQRLRKTLDYYLQSDVAKADALLVEKEIIQDMENRQLQLNKDKAGGINRDTQIMRVLNEAGYTIKSLINHPVTGVNNILEVTPQLLSGGAAGKFAINQATKRIVGGLKNPAVIRGILNTPAAKKQMIVAAEKAGIVNTVAMESGSAYLDARSNVLETSFEDLAKTSDLFNQYVAGGLSQEEARDKLSYHTADLVGISTAILAGVTSKFTGQGKFEGTIFTSTKALNAKNALTGAANIVGRVGLAGSREAVEEGFQSGGGELIQNIAERSTSNADKDIYENVGRAAGEGIFAGFGSAALISSFKEGPGALLNTARGTGAVLKSTGKGINKVIKPITKFAKDAKTLFESEGLTITDLLNPKNKKYNPGLAMKTAFHEYSRLGSDNNVAKQDYLDSELTPAFTSVLSQYSDTILAAEEETDIRKKSQLLTQAAELKAVMNENGPKIQAIRKKVSEQNKKSTEEAIHTVVEEGNSEHAEGDVLAITIGLIEGLDDGNISSTYDDLINNEDVDPAIRELASTAKKLLAERVTFSEKYGKESNRAAMEVIGEGTNAAGRLGATAHTLAVLDAIRTGNTAVAKATLATMNRWLKTRLAKIAAIEDPIARFKAGKNPAGEEVIIPGVDKPFTVEPGSIKHLAALKAETKILQGKRDIAEAALKLVRDTSNLSPTQEEVDTEKAADTDAEAATEETKVETPGKESKVDLIARIAKAASILLKANLMNATDKARMKVLDTMEYEKLERVISNFEARVGHLADQNIQPPSKLSETEDDEEEKTGEKTESKTPVFDALPEKDTTKKSMTYAGIGSRSTPEAIIVEMRAAAKMLSEAGYTLNTGDAKGADAAFLSGAHQNEGAQTVAFNANDATDQTRAIAKEIHPNPGALSGYILGLMARNTFQVFGHKLDTPVDFVLTYTPDGAISSEQRTRATGGTGQAIDMASRKGIPVINMANEGWKAELAAVLKNDTEETVVQSDEDFIKTYKDKEHQTSADFYLDELWKAKQKGELSYKIEGKRTTPFDPALFDKARKVMETNIAEFSNRTEKEKEAHSKESQEFYNRIVHPEGPIREIYDKLIFDAEKKRLDLPQIISVKNGEAFKAGVRKAPGEIGEPYSNIAYCHGCATESTEKLKLSGLMNSSIYSMGQKDFSGFTDRIGDHKVAITEVDGVAYIVDHPQREFFKPLDPPKSNTGIVTSDKFRPYFIEVTPEALIDKYGIDQADADSTTLDIVEILKIKTIPSSILEAKKNKEHRDSMLNTLEILKIKTIPSSILEAKKNKEHRDSMLNTLLEDYLYTYEAKEDTPEKFKRFLKNSLLVKKLPLDKLQEVYDYFTKSSSTQEDSPPQVDKVSSTEDFKVEPNIDYFNFLLVAAAQLDPEVKGNLNRIAFFSSLLDEMRKGKSFEDLTKDLSLKENQYIQSLVQQNKDILLYPSPEIQEMQETLITAIEEGISLPAFVDLFSKMNKKNKISNVLLNAIKHVLPETKVEIYDIAHPDTTRFDRNSGGTYTPGKDTIRIATYFDENNIRRFVNKNDTFEIFPHEILHAATVKRIRDIINDPQEFTEESKEAKALDELRRINQLLQNEAKGNPSGKVASILKSIGETPRKTIEDEGDTLSETLAYGLTSPVIKEFLLSKKLSGKNAWSVFVQNIRDLLDIPEAATTEFDNLIAATELVLRVDQREESKPIPESELPPFTSEEERESSSTQEDSADTSVPEAGIETSIPSTSKIEESILDTTTTESKGKVKVEESDPNKLFKTTGKSSALSRILNLFSKLGDAVTRAEIAQQLNLDETELGKMDKLSDYITYFSKHMDKLYKNEKWGNTLDNSPSNYFRMVNGKLPENLIAAIAMVSYTWINTRGTDTLNVTDSNINGFLGRSSKTPIDAKAWMLFSKLGSQRANIAEEIGVEIQQQLGLSVHHTTGGGIEAQLTMDLGLMAINTMQEMGVLDVKFVKNKTLNDNIRTEAEVAKNKNEDAIIYFVQIPSEIFQKEDLIYKAPSRHLKNSIKDFNENFKDIIKKTLSLTDPADYPSTTPVTTIPQRLSGTFMESSSDVKKAIKHYQTVPFKIKRSMAKLFNSMSESTFMKVTGYKDPAAVHISQRASQEAINQGLTRTYWHIKDYLESDMSEKAFYNKMAVWNNNRIGDAPTKLSLQRDIIIRHMFGASAWDVEVTTNNSDGSIDLLQRGIMEAFGYAGMSLEKQLALFTQEVFDPATKELKSDYKAAVEALLTVKNAEELGSISEGKEKKILEGVLKGKEGIYSLDGLVALTDYYDAVINDKNTFEVSLAIEVDGITNGIIASALQLGLPLDYAKKILIPGGVSFMNEMDNDYDSYYRKKEKQNFRDNYENLTVLSHKKLENQLTDKDTDFRTKNAITGLRNIMKPFFNPDGTVSKAGRALNKPILMLTVYGSSVFAMKKKMGAVLLNELYSSMVTAEIEDNKLNDVNKTLQVALIKNLALILPYSKYAKWAQSNSILVNLNRMQKGLKNHSLEARDVKSFLIGAESTSGKAATDAAQDYFGDLIKHQKAINDMTNIAIAIFKAHYNMNAAVISKDRNNGKRITKEQHVEIMLRLRDKGLYPGGKHASSKDETDSLEIIKYGKVDLTKDKHGKVKHSFIKGITFDEVIFDENEKVKIKEIKEEEEEESKFWNTSERARVREPESTAGAMPFAIKNQSGDGNTQLPLMTNSDYSMINAFDASIESLFKIDSIANAGNESFSNVHFNWSMMGETFTNLNRLMFTFKHLPLAERKKIFVALESIIDFPNSNKSDYLIETVKEFGALTTLVKKRNKIVHENVLSVEQFPSTNAAHVFKDRLTNEKPTIVDTPENTPPGSNAISKELKLASNARIQDTPTEKVNRTISPPGINVTDTQQSDPDAFSNDYVPVYDVSATAGTIEDTFDRLANIGNVQDSTEHTTYLRGLIHNLVKPGLVYLDNLMIEVGKTEGPNRGKFERYTDGGKVYVAGSSSVANSFAEMSTQEILAHESVHAVLGVGIEMDSKMRKELAYLYETALKATDANGNLIITAESFLRRDETGAILIADTLEHEMEIAQKRYDYVFDTKKHPNQYLHEFATIGLTNESFINTLAQIDVEKPANIYEGSIVTRLVQFYSNILNTIFNHKFKNSSGKIDSALRNLAVNSNQVQRASLGKIDQAALKFYSFNSVASKVLMKYAYKPYANYVERRLKTTFEDHPIRKPLDTVIGLPYNIAQKEFRQAISEVAMNMGYTRQNTFYKGITEFRGATHLTQWLHNLTMQNNHDHDQVRERTANDTADQISKLFLSKKPSQREWRMLTAGALKTDLSLLMTIMNVDQILVLLRQPAALQRAIEGQRGRMNKYQEAEYYKIQAKNLGHFMVDGRSRIDDGMLNAFNIAGMESVEGMNIEEKVTEAAEKEIDILASLYALKYTNQKTKKVTAKFLEDEYNLNNVNNGMDMLLSMHKAFKEDSLEKLFSGNKRSIIKGWTFEMYDDLKTSQVATLADEAELKKAGFDRIAPINRDINSNIRGQQHYLYVSRDGLLNKRISGAVSTTNLLSKGHAILDLFEQDGKVINKHVATTKELRLQRAKNRRSVQRQRQGLVDLNDQNNYMIPIVNTSDGNIGNYRYMMSESTKENYMGKKDLAHIVMGRMQASIIDKVQTPIGNKKYVLGAKADYDKYFQNNPEDFVLVGPSATNKQLKEIYNLFPDSMKTQIKETWGSDDMFIREETIDAAFGYRKASITGYIDENIIKLPILMKRAMRHAGIIWESIVARQKRNIVIFLPETLVSNMVSNEYLLIMSGVPPKYSFKYQGEALIHISNYNKNLREKEDLERINKAKPNAASFKRNEQRIARLTGELEKSPISYLVEHGVFQNISEDVREDSERSVLGSISNALNIDKFTQNATDLIPNFVKTAYDQTVFAPGTESNKRLTRATQYSDFIARFALFKWQTENQGISRETALITAVDTFINYDIPTSPAVQWLNDMGILQFTKFYFRIQRVILRRAEESPLTVGSIKMAQTLTGDVPEIFDSIITPAGMINRSPGARQVLDQAFEPNLYNQLDWFDYLPFF